MRWYEKKNFQKSKNEFLKHLILKFFRASVDMIPSLKFMHEIFFWKIVKIFEELEVSLGEPKTIVIWQNWKFATETFNFSFGLMLSSNFVLYFSCFFLNYALNKVMSFKQYTTFKEITFVSQNYKKVKIICILLGGKTVDTSKLCNTIQIYFSCFLLVTARSKYDHLNNQRNPSSQFNPFFRSSITNYDRWPGQKINLLST